MKLFLFDCDETLWTSPKKDYISRVPSPFKKVGSSEILREADQYAFRLQPSVQETFAYLAGRNDTAVGIVSDNLFEPVQQALMFFDLWSFIDSNAVNVRLWQGYCPKHEMILEILNRPVFLPTVLLQDTYWFDDKDYQKEADGIGVHFIQVSLETNLLTCVKKIMKDL